MCMRYTVRVFTNTHRYDDAFHLFCPAIVTTESRVQMCALETLTHHSLMPPTLSSSPNTSPCIAPGRTIRESPMRMSEMRRCLWRPYQHFVVGHGVLSEAVAVEGDAVGGGAGVHGVYLPGEQAVVNPSQSSWSTQMRPGKYACFHTHTHNQIGRASCRERV